MKTIKELLNGAFDYMLELMQLARLSGEKININSKAPFSYKEPSKEYKSANDLSKAMFSFMIEESGFNKLPTVLGCNEFKNENGMTFYHGFKKPMYAYDFLNNELYHYGNGLTEDNKYINGFYLTKNKRLASIYASKDLDKENPQNVLSIKLENVDSIRISEIRELLANSSCENEKYNSLFNELVEELNSLKQQTNNSRDFKMFSKSLLSNYSTIAVILGAGILIEDEKTYNKDNNEQVIVLNRGAVAVDKLEVDNILSRLDESKQ